MLAFFDAMIEAGNLTSVHPPPGNQKLNAFRVLLVNENWAVVLSLCDGKPSPLDFVEGLAREELHSKIQAMFVDVNGAAYSHFKQTRKMI